MLTQEQKELVGQWVAGGMSLSDVQKKIKEDLGVAMLYMDVRLLVLEIGAQVKDKEEPKKIVPPPDQVPADEVPAEGAEEPAAGGVEVVLDTLVVPGAMVSGQVVFSDGEKARWLIDEQGRFGLEPSTQGYKPSDEDLQMFQMHLRALLKRQGMM